MKFDKVKYFYESELWSKNMVKTAVKKGVITKEQYTEITGEVYVAPAVFIPNVTAADIKELKTQIAELTEHNTMLEECIVEMAEIVYA